MPLCVPLDTDDEKKRGWYVVTKTRAGETLLKAINPPARFTEAATRLILKLAAGHKLALEEVLALELLHGLYMMGTNKTQYQIIGHKVFSKAIERYVSEVDMGGECDSADAQRAALKALGLSG